MKGNLLEKANEAEVQEIAGLLGGLIGDNGINDFKSRVNERGGEWDNDKVTFKILPLQPNETGNLKARRLELITKGDEAISIDVGTWSRNLEGLAEQLIARGITASDLEEFSTESD